MIKTNTYRNDIAEDLIDYSGENKQKFFELTQLTRNLGLNYVEEVGSLSYLTRAKHFKTFNEFKAYYFKTGEESLPYRLKATDKNDNIHKINGRTKQEIQDKIKKLYEATNNKHLIKHYYPSLTDNVTIEDCANSFLHLLFTHSWNGYITEQNVISMLKQDELLEDFYIEHTTPEDDLNYNIDILLIDKETEEVIAGYQIKPMKYLTYDNEIKQRDLDKINRFKKDYNCTIHGYLYSDKTATNTNWQTLSSTLIYEYYVNLKG